MKIHNQRPGDINEEAPADVYRLGLPKNPGSPLGNVPPGRGLREAVGVREMR